MWVAFFSDIEIMSHHLHTIKKFNLIITWSIGLVKLLVSSKDVLQLCLEVVVLIRGGVPGPLPAGLPGPGAWLGRDLGRQLGPGLGWRPARARGLDDGRPETLITWGKQDYSIVFFIFHN